MIRSILFAIMIFITLLVAFGGNSGTVQAFERQSAPGDLFYNFYAAPVGCPSVGAALYPSPRPVPPVVGQTNITYQPLMPHEFLYHHHRTYTNIHSDGSRTHTSVSWR